MELGLEGRTALVTGGSKGIGRAVAETLAAEGCHLALVARTSADLEKAQAEIGEAFGVRIDTFATDLSLSASVNAVAERFGGVDILVNNAGAIPRGSLCEIDEARWRAAWELKVFGYINMCRRFYLRMRERGSGVIVNIIGNAAQTHDPEYLCGVTGNAALTAFTQSLGSASARDGVRVVGINPGPVATDRLVNRLRLQAKTATGDPDRWQDLLKPMPYGRAAMPAEIAAAVAFLASERSAYTSGSIAIIDAGFSARAQSL